MLALESPGRPRTITLNVSAGCAAALPASPVGTNALFEAANAVALSARKDTVAARRTTATRPRSVRRGSPPLPPVPHNALPRSCRKSFLLLRPLGGPQFVAG